MLNSYGYGSKVPAENSDQRKKDLLRELKFALGIKYSTPVNEDVPKTPLIEDTNLYHPILTIQHAKKQLPISISKPLQDSSTLHSNTLDTNFDKEDLINISDSQPRFIDGRSSTVRTEARILASQPNHAIRRV